MQKLGMGPIRKDIRTLLISSHHMECPVHITWMLPDILDSLPTNNLQVISYESTSASELKKLKSLITSRKLVLGQ